jgi:hypothetical protein
MNREIPKNETPPWIKEREMRQQNARAIIDHARPRIDERNFQSVYRDGFREYSVEQDIGVADIMEKEFAAKHADKSEEVKRKIREGKERSEALEIFIVDGGEEFQYFGEKAYLSRTAKIDDFKNGVDAVVTFDLPDKNPYCIALAIDASMKPTFESVEKKLNRNLTKVIGDSRKGLEVKYYESPITKKKERLGLIVPVVVGLEGDNSNKILAIFADIIRLRMKEGQTAEENQRLQNTIEKIKNHPAQIIFLQEIKKQLEMYSVLLKKENSTPKAAASGFGKLSGMRNNMFTSEIDKLTGIIDDILDSKKHIPSGELENDGVYTCIKKFINEKLP